MNTVDAPLAGPMGARLYNMFILKLTNLTHSLLDSETDEEICIPQNADADVCFNILDGVPGLQVTTKHSSKWTPIAPKTRSKF